MRLPLKKHKAQSAVEYLTTYSWALLIVGAVSVALILLNVFNPGAFVSNSCTVPQFSCLNVELNTAGSMFVNIQQNTGSNINITAIACSDNINNAKYQALSPQVELTTASNTTFVLNCYANGNVFSGGLTGFYKGYLIINYTITQSVLPHQSSGLIVQKVVTSGSVPI